MVYVGLDVSGGEVVGLCCGGDLVEDGEIGIEDGASSGRLFMEEFRVAVMSCDGLDMP